MKTIFIVMRFILPFKQILRKKESSTLNISNGTLRKGKVTMSFSGLETHPSAHLSNTYPTVHIWWENAFLAVGQSPEQPQKPTVPWKRKQYLIKILMPYWSKSGALFTS